MASSSDFFPADQLPDWGLVHIFSYLNVKQKCRVAGVSKRWNSVAKNPSLWTTVNDHPQDSGSLLTFIRMYLGKSLQSFRSVSHITTAGLKLLERMCPNLEKIWLDNLGMDRTPDRTINLSFVPSRISALTLVTQPGQLQLGQSRDNWWAALSPTNFPSLKFLFLRGFDEEDEEEIFKRVAHFKALTGLRLEEMTAESGGKYVASMAETWKNLELLSFDGCAYIMESLMQANLWRNLLKLTHIKLNGIMDMEKIGEQLAPLAALPRLQHLEILDIELTGEETLKAVLNMAKEISDAVKTFPEGVLQELLVTVEPEIFAEVSETERILFNLGLVMNLRNSLPGVTVNPTQKPEEKYCTVSGMWQSDVPFFRRSSLWGYDE